MGASWTLERIWREESSTVAVAAMRHRYWARAVCVLLEGKVVKYTDIKHAPSLRPLWRLCLKYTDTPSDGLDGLRVRILYDNVSQVLRGSQAQAHALALELRQTLTWH